MVTVATLYITSINAFLVTVRQHNFLFSEWNTTTITNCHTVKWRRPELFLWIHKGRHRLYSHFHRLCHISGIFEAFCWTVLSVVWGFHFDRFDRFKIEEKWQFYTKQWYWNVSVVEECFNYRLFLFFFLFCSRWE